MPTRTDTLFPDTTLFRSILAGLGRGVGTTPGAVASGGARPAQTLAGRQAVAAMQDRRSELVSNVARARATLTRWTGDPAPEIAGPIPDFAVDAAEIGRANV